MLLLVRHLLLVVTMFAIHIASVRRIRGRHRPGRPDASAGRRPSDITVAHRADTTDGHPDFVCFNQKTWKRIFFLQSQACPMNRDLHGFAIRILEQLYLFPVVWDGLVFFGRVFTNQLDLPSCRCPGWRSICSMGTSSQVTSTGRRW